jgi:hypothetical protein
MSEYGGHVPKRIQTEPVETPLIDGHTSECLRACEQRDLEKLTNLSYSCPGCLKIFLKVFRLKV